MGESQLRALLILTGVLLLASPGTAGAAPVCNGQEFCVDETLALTSDPPGMVAGAPLDVDLSVQNTSSPLDQAHWMKSVTVVLDDSASEADPPLTPSASLPNGLILAGGGTCAPPTYSGCAGGHGTFVIRVPIFGESTGAFGIARIVNVNPPAPGAWAHYELTIKLCKGSGANCNPDPDTSLDVEIPPSAASELTIPTEVIQPPPFAIEFSLTSLTFHLDGQSSEIEGQAPAPSPYTVLAVPRECGPVAGTSAYASRESGSVTIPHDFSVTGCPTAALAPYDRSGAAIRLDGSPSAAQVSGRDVARWHWDFGDGTEAVTTTPTVSHDYEPGTEHTVSLLVEDSAGALSTAAATQTVELPAGSLLTVAVSGPGSVGGGAGGVEGDSISCPPTCSAIYPPGTATSLTATPASGFLFAGWGGDCAGTGPCDLTMSADRDVTAKFEAPPSAPASSASAASSQPPPNTRLKKSTVKGRKATFAFEAVGTAGGFQCALTPARKRAKAKFRSCRSPKTYRRLKPGRFLFQVRAVGAGGPDPTPAKKRFTIRPRRA